MMQIVVKTLDGKDHNFDVSESYTIRQFKEFISETVGMDPDRQRVIYRGRVLQDDKSLSELDLNGKVVHLVEKPANRQSEVRENTVLPPSTRRREVAQQQVMIGSVAIPMMDLSQEELVQSIRRVLDRLGEIGRRATISVHARDNGALDVVLHLRGLPPTEIDSPAFARLQHIRHVLRHINHSLYHIENDEDTRAEGIASANSASSHSAVDHVDRDTSIIPDGCDAESHQITTTGEENPSENANQSSRNATAAGSVLEELDGVEANPNVETGENRRQLRTRDAMVADLAKAFEEVTRLEDRLRPHRLRFLTLLRNDSNFANNIEEGRRTSRFFNAMQVVMHNLSHVYHVMSDFNIHFCQLPPRVLEPRLVETDSTFTLHEPEAQITMSFRRANGSSESSVNEAGSQTHASSAEASANSMDSSTPSSFNASSAPNSRVNVQVTPGGFTMSQAQSASFTLPTDHRMTSTNNGEQVQTANTSAGQQQQNATPTQQQQQPNFFQQIMQGVANAGVFLGLAPTIGGMHHQNQAPDAAANASAANMFRQQFPSGGTMNFQFGGGRLPPSLFAVPQPNNNMANLLRNFQQQRPPISVNINQRPAHQRLNAPFRMGSPRHSGVSQTAVIVNPPNAEPIFVGPRPPVSLPLFTVDPYLPCPSRHFDVRTRSPVMRRRNVTPTPDAPATEAVPATVDAPVEPHFNDINEFESNIEHILRSVLEGMNDQPITNPASLGMYSYASVGNSTVAQNGNAFQHYVNGTSSAAAQANMASGHQFSSSASRSSNVSSSSTTVGADATISDHEVENVISSLFQTLATNPNTSVADFMRTVDREVEEPTASVFSNIVRVLSQVLSLMDLLPLFSGASTAPLERARSPLRRYFIENVLFGNDRPSVEDLKHAASRVVSTDVEHFRNLLKDCTPTDDIDLERTMLSAYESRILDLLNLCFGYSSDSHNFGDSFYNLVWLCLREILSIGVHYNARGREGFEDASVKFLESSMVGMSAEMIQMMMTSGRERVHNLIHDHLLPQSDVEQFVLHRQASNLEESSSQQTPLNTSIVDTQMETDSEVQRDEVLRHNQEEKQVSSNSNDESDWKRHLPPAWVAVVEKDIDRQNAQPVQRPFSDAYMNGMPMKRRKVVCENKPRLNVESTTMLQQTLQKATEDAGVAGNAEVSEIPATLLESFEQSFEEKVRHRALNDPDFDEKRFPNVKKLFNT